jgi:hypothetical protein
MGVSAADSFPETAQLIQLELARLLGGSSGAWRPGRDGAGLPDGAGRNHRAGEDETLPAIVGGSQRPAGVRARPLLRPGSREAQAVA